MKLIRFVWQWLDQNHKSIVSLVAIFTVTLGYLNHRANYGKDVNPHDGGGQNNQAVNANNNQSSSVTVYNNSPIDNSVHTTVSVLTTTTLMTNPQVMTTSTPQATNMAASVATSIETPRQLSVFSEIHVGDSIKFNAFKGDSSRRTFQKQAAWKKTAALDIQPNTEYVVKDKNVYWWTWPWLQLQSTDGKKTGWFPWGNTTFDTYLCNTNNQ